MPDLRRWKRIRPIHHGVVVQQAAHRTFNPVGVGSIPSGPTRWRVAQRRERRPYKTQVVGSTPIAPT